MIKAVQNVVVELQYRAASSKGSSPQPALQSIYTGWTGMSSQRRPSSIIGKGTTKTASVRESECGVVELDATFGQVIGLTEGQRVV